MNQSHINIDDIQNLQVKNPLPIIGDGAFGGVYTAFTSFDKYTAIADELGTGLIRWPGGTLAEVREDRYGLEFDQLQVAGPNRPGLSDLIEYSHESGDILSVIIPTVRYSDDIDLGAKHVSDFMDKLIDGYYGKVPEGFTLEIGNEYFAHFSDPALYGKISDKFLTVISEKLEGMPEGFPKINITMQAGRTLADNDLIMDEMNSDALSVITHIAAHRFSPQLEKNDWQLPDLKESLGEWREAVTDTGADTPNLYFSAWNVASWTRSDAAKDFENIYYESFGKEINLSSDALSNRTNEEFERFWQNGILTGPNGESVQTGLGLANHDYGPEKEAAILEMFTEYSKLGLDMSAIYGIDIPHPSNFGSVTGKGQEMDVDLFSGSGALKLLAEMVPGMSAVDTGHRNVADPNEQTGANQWIFEDDDKIAIFMSSGSLENGETLDVSLNLGDDIVAAYGDVVVRTPQEDLEEKSDTPKTPNVDTKPESEMYDEVSVEGFIPEINSGVLNYKFTEPYQMVRITLALNEKTVEELDDSMRAPAMENDKYVDLEVPSPSPPNGEEPDSDPIPDHSDLPPVNSPPPKPPTQPENGPEKPVEEPDEAEEPLPHVPPINDNEDVENPLFPEVPPEEHEERPEDTDDGTDGQGSGGGCFVATATYQDPMHPDVTWLRKFRDEILIPHPIGRKIVVCYWVIGRPLSKIPHRSTLARKAFRFILSQTIHFGRKVTSV